MAEDDGGLLQAFLNTQETLTRDGAQNILVVDSSNPVSWLRVFGAIVTGIVAQITTGLAQYPLNAASAVNDILSAILSIYVGRVQTTESGRIDGTASTVKIDGLFDVVVGGLTTAANDVWAQSLDQFGLFALPVSFIILLASVYLFVQGVRIAFAVIRGEEVG